MKLSFRTCWTFKTIEQIVLSFRTCWTLLHKVPEESPFIWKAESNLVVWSHLEFVSTDDRLNIYAPTNIHQHVLQISTIMYNSYKKQPTCPTNIRTIKSTFKPLGFIVKSKKFTVHLTFSHGAFLSFRLKEISISLLEFYVKRISIAHIKGRNSQT